MIIYGTKGVERTLSRGNFSCPSCTKKRSYRIIEVKKYFTLYFIPIIPLNRLGSYVECLYCKGTFKKTVLRKSKALERKAQKDSSPAVNTMDAEQAEYIEAIKNVMLLIMMADGVIDDGELEQIAAVYKQFTNQYLTKEHIKLSGEQMAKEQKTLKDYLKDVYPKLNLQGKIKVLQAAMEIASADGEFQLQEQQMIYNLVNILQIPVENANRIVQQYFDIDVTSIVFMCPNCQHPTNLKHSFKPVGKKKKCKKCQHVYPLSHKTAKTVTLLNPSSQLVTQLCTSCNNQFYIKLGLPAAQQTCVYCAKNVDNLSLYFDYEKHKTPESMVGKKIVINNATYTLDNYVEKNKQYFMFTLRNDVSNLILSTAGICEFPVDSEECKQCLQQTIQGGEALRTAGIHYLYAAFHQTQGALIKIQPCRYSVKNAAYFEELVAEASTCFNNKDYQQALKIYNSILSQNRHHTHALINKARCLMFLQQLDAAKHFATNAIDIEPNQPSYHVLLAYIFAYSGNFAMAMQLLDPWIAKAEHDIDTSLAYLTISAEFDTAYFYQQQVGYITNLYKSYAEFQALQDSLQKSLERSHRYTQYVVEAYKIQSSTPKNWQAAADLCLQAKNITVNNYIAQMNHYVCLYHLGQFDKISGYLDSLLYVLRKNNFNSACILCALSYANQKNWEKAKVIIFLLIDLADSWGLPLKHPVDLPSIPCAIDVYGKQDIEQKTGKDVMELLLNISKFTQVNAEEQQQLKNLIVLYHQREKIMFEQSSS
ncbi:TerB family tellurite resistance protein [Candidatus Uabimicrobium amorphum]|uniref:Zinc-ribbon 15 domain-containing protein n=1 Tax=Uabimicrobium amorphum TaxID=2596890 RepID=A0A5S9IIA6_UABAM|nr:TerB family tellurite resistance protein [Candidatus Uabimicrobium amorphum]BBM82348.1 hypothetical protein UABAM_00691 [Candidatus Uabimicrobium amorphum]